MVFGAGAEQIDLIGRRSLDQRFGIRVSGIAPIAALEVIPVALRRHEYREGRVDLGWEQ